MWAVKATVFKLILRMQDVVFLLIWSMMQLFNCGVLSKIQLLPILETCDEGSKDGEMASLPETYVLSPRKLIEKSVLATLERRDCNLSGYNYSEY